MPFPSWPVHRTVENILPFGSGRKGVAAAAVVTLDIESGQEETLARA